MSVLDDIKNNAVTVVIGLALIGGAVGVWVVAGNFFKPKIELQERRADNEGMVGDRRGEEQTEQSKLDGMTGDFRAQNSSARVSQERVNARISQAPSASQSVPDDVVVLLRDHDERLRAILAERRSRSGDRGENPAPR